MMKKWQVIEGKIMELNDLIKKQEIWRLKGDRIVFTNGCFDLLHEGHVQLIANAADCGNRLVLGLNSDASVRRLKGLKRPLNDQESRAKVLASLLFIDAVIVFEEDTPLELIKSLEPDVLVKGGDYQLEDIVGAQQVMERGGEVVIVPLIEGKSTTQLIHKMKI